MVTVTVRGNDPSNRVAVCEGETIVFTVQDLPFGNLVQTPQQQSSQEKGEAGCTVHL